MLEHKIIGRNISILYRSESNYTDKRIKNMNINKIQVEVLLFIKDNPGTNLTEINNFFRFNKATISKIVKHLEAEKYVLASINTFDKREKCLEATEKGLLILPEVKKIFNIWETEIIKDIPNHQIEITRNVLAKMVNNISSLNGEPNE